MKGLLLDEWAAVCARPVSIVVVDLLSLAFSADFSGRRLLSVLGCGTLVGLFVVCFRSSPAGSTKLPLACLSATSGLRID